MDANSGQTRFMADAHCLPRRNSTAHRRYAVPACVCSRSTLSARTLLWDKDVHKISVQVMLLNTSNIGKKRARSESNPTNTLDPATKRRRPESDTFHVQDGDCEPSTLIGNAQALAISNTLPRQDSGRWTIDSELSGPTDQIYQVPCTAHESDDIVITAIRATDVTLGLRRLPAGFFAVLHHNGLEWRTENKLSSLPDDAVEWNGPIPISSDMSATICFEVYASFEVEPTLGSGEQLRKFTTTVNQLLDRSEIDSPFTFFPKNGDVVSPCSSVFVVVKRKKCQCEHARPSTSKVSGPHWSTPQTRSELEDATDLGHRALLRYQKHGERQDLERSVKEFEHALNICSLGHSFRAVAQSNLAIAELVRFQVQGVDSSLELALRLYQDALAVRPIGHPDRPSTLIHLAMVHLVRFQTRKDHDDEQRAQNLLEEVSDSRSTERYARQASNVLQQILVERNIDLVQPDRQSSVERNASSQLPSGDPWIFSAWLLNRIVRFNDPADIQKAVSILQDLVKSTSPWDSRYAFALQNLGTALDRRFDHLGELIDIEEAISKRRDAVTLTPHGHPDKPGYLSNLGLSFQARFERLGNLSDLEEAISSQREAIQLSPHDHPHKSCYLDYLGHCFKVRFKRLGRLSDLEDAISNERDAIDLTPRSHPHMPRLLDNLGDYLMIRFKHLGELRDLEDSISSLREANDLTPHSDPEKRCYLDNLGNALATRFERLNQLRDIEDSILKLGEAVVLTPHGDRNKPGYLNNLGLSLKARFERLGKLSDLEDTISRLKDAVKLVPDGQPHKPVILANLANSFSARFQCLGVLSDLEDEISMRRGVVALTSRGDPDIPGSLHNLGLSLRTRFEYLSQPQDLEDAILGQKEALDLTPYGHPHRPILLNNLGNLLRRRFERLGQLSDLEDAILTQRDAVDLTPHGDPSKSCHFSSLGGCFLARFQRLGRLSDLKDALSSHSNAVDLTPDCQPDKPTHIHNLGNSYFIRFQRLGELCDLEEAILREREAVALTPHGHPGKPSHLNNLGVYLTARFEHLEDLSDLEDAISSLRDAVNITPRGHSNRPSCLYKLGTSFLVRFQRLGELSDLGDAISSWREAVDLIPDGHPDKPRYLNGLSDSLRTRFPYLRQRNDLEDAISSQKIAVDLTPDDHPSRPDYLQGLGLSLESRFECLGQLSDLEDAISSHRKAVDLTPHNHPHKPGCLNNLALSLRTRFEHLGQLSDLANATSTLRSAVGCSPHGHPQKPILLINLGHSVTTCFERFGEISLLEQAISLFSHAASSPIGPLDVRFCASQEWISCAQRIRHPSLLHAYSVALGLLPQLAWIGLSLQHRYEQLTGCATIVQNAVAAALDAGFAETAVEWLEQGRSIVWAELLQLRSSCEELSTAHPDHARRLRELSAELDQASAAREMASARTEGTPPHGADSPRQVADRHRRLAIKRDKLLQEIRRLPRFAQFLRPKRFSQLRASAHAGPVVILNAATTRCDALVVLADLDHVIHVPLPNFTYGESIGLQNVMKDFVRDARAGGRATLPRVTWESILSPLWKSVVKPVLDALAFSAPGDLSRIFWCPTGPFAFLPIHAAGLYGTRYSKSGHKLSDFLISSYTPTLSILSPSPNPCTAHISDLRLLAVRQPSSDGLVPLSGVGPELDHIREVIRNSPRSETTFLESPNGTVDEVLSLMKDTDWVHFSCHGVQDTADATHSGLCLANGSRLALRDIIALRRPRGGLAFLSACETAKGDVRLSEEATHIAAGMLFAGYGGVVGTMWTISDRLAPKVARDVYVYLFREGRRPEYREAARALHDAVGRARRGGASFSDWIPFIHLGL